MEPKRTPKVSLFGNSENDCIPCVFAQNGPPKGGQKWSQNGAGNNPKMGSDFGQNRLKNPSKKIPPERKNQNPRRLYQKTSRR